MKEERILICARARKRAPPLPSTIDSCDLCGHDVWRARSSPAVDRVICIECSAEEIKPDTKVEPPTQRQLAEIAKALNTKH